MRGGPPRGPTWSLTANGSVLAWRICQHRMRAIVSLGPMLWKPQEALAPTSRLLADVERTVVSGPPNTASLGCAHRRSVREFPGTSQVRLILPKLRPDGLPPTALQGQAGVAHDLMQALP